MEMNNGVDEESKGGESAANSRLQILLLILDKSKPYILCIFSNLCYAGFNILSKVTLDHGMSLYVLVAYGHAFATVTTFLLAFLFERKNEARISLRLCGDVFFLGLFGTLLRTMYYAGMDNTSPTFASAMGNLTPAITFLSAILCRMENLKIKEQSGQAKIGGTLISFGGATVMTLYKGINLFSLRNSHNHHQIVHSNSKVFPDQDWIKGSLFLFLSTLSTAAFYILQAKTIKKYPAPISLTALSCLAGTVISTLTAAIFDHKASAWRLSWNVSLVAVVYSGVVIFGITVYLQTLAIRIKGPVFVTAFKPLATTTVAFMGVLILGEPLHLGSVLGAIVIIVGLYALLWGKEEERENKLSQHTTPNHTIETKPDQV